MSPKAFISYSWTSPGHQAGIVQWAEQLVGDGVDVVLDVWDLKEGDDKFAFMERMVTDDSVTHVIVFSDSGYSAKADARKAGVGTESQIISREVYAKVQQSKFIPVVCELDDAGEPALPTFLKSRIWIDFSSPEAANDNWEQLIRVLFGKPALEKPTLGKAPAYILEGSGAPASPAITKYAALRQAILGSKPGLALYRQDFLDACIEYADALRIRERPVVESLGERILEDCGKLRLVRNQIVDWVLLEAEARVDAGFAESLILLLERMLDLKSRPAELNQWNDAWFGAHSMFVYETFLYVVAALIRAGAFDVLHEVLTSSYLLPEASAHGRNRFTDFGAFYGHSEVLQSVLAPEGRRLLSPAAELIKRQADRSDIKFEAVMEAELLVLLMATISPDVRWYPQTLHYAGYSSAFDFFLRATQHKHFKNLAVVTGIDDADTLRELVKAGMERLEVRRWSNFEFFNESFWTMFNLDDMDTRN